jgi:hypothetical protein
MKPISPNKLKAINTLISKYGIDKEVKALMVEGFSLGRCSSSKELTDEEGTLMLQHLQDNDPNRAAIEKMKGKIFYYCHEMGWTIAKQTGKRVVDMKRLDEWCKTRSYLKKKLDWYKYKELPKLVTQFEAVYASFMESLNKK